MPTLHITIDLDNEAFQDGNRDYEVARILHAAANKIDVRGIEDVSRLLDSNGNTVGDVMLRSDDDSDARLLADIARDVRLNDPMRDGTYTNPLVRSAAYYLAAIGHAAAPKWAKKQH